MRNKAVTVAAFNIPLETSLFTRVKRREIAILLHITAYISISIPVMEAPIQYLTRRLH